MNLLTDLVEPYSTTSPQEITSMSSNAPLSVERYATTINGMKSHIRERIKAARLHAQLTQEQLGERIGISKSAVSMWETTNLQKWTRPTLDNLKSLSKITGAPLDWLLDDEASISDDWKRPAEVVAFPNAAPKPTTLSLEAAQLIDQLSQSEQVELLHYLRVRIQTMGHKPSPGQ